MSEYVRFIPNESLYGEKNLLHSELSMLTLVKKIRNFKALINEEHKMRLLFKKKFKELHEILKEFDKLLPEDHFALKRKAKEESKEKSKEKFEALTLEQEIELIRRKLQKLEISQ